MNNERLSKILLAPHSSEKSVRIADKHRQVVFKVAKDSNKLEIKRAVEKMFEVEVSAVTTAIVKGKTKMTGRIRGKRKDWKKACVTLKPGFDIQFSGEA
jgi:large subunit ribosomal protein L23